MNDKIKEASAAYQAEERPFASNNFHPDGMLTHRASNNTKHRGIPKDWKTVPIGSFNPFVTSGSRGWAKYYASYGDPFIRITNLSRQSIRPDLEDLRYVSLPNISAEGRRTQLKNGDLLISITADIGIIGYVDELIPKPSYINQHIALVRFQSDDVVPKYVAYFLASEQVQTLFREGTDQGAKAGINLARVRAINVAVPEKNEQTAIANALSDVDAVIDSLEALIAKKQAIKTAAMQQLLTGRTRLPQFALNPDGTVKGTKHTELGQTPEDWETYLLADLMEYCSSGATPYRGNPNYYKGANRWITSGELKYCVINDTIEKLSDEALQKSNLKVHPAGTFLMAITGLEAAGTRGACGIVGRPAATNQSCMAIYPNEKLNSRYLYYWYLHNGNELAFKYCQGTKQLSYTAGLIKKIPISIPKNTEEQIAISTVLYEMDVEIENLHQRLSKTREIKQGMMQELLTGKTRMKP